jgi:hypothetical protein
MSGAAIVATIDSNGDSKVANTKIALLTSGNLPVFGPANMVVAGTTNIYVGAQTTRDTVRAEVGLLGAIGSVYFSSAGKIYLKVANADATADWAKVTSSAAD